MTILSTLRGFKLYKRAAKHTAFVDDEKVKDEYYPESIEVIKKLTGASRVILFDHSKQPLTSCDSCVMNDSDFHSVH